MNVDETARKAMAALAVLSAAPVVVLGCLATPCLGSSLNITIQPGPTVMSPEEKAIQADPAKGIQDGVILVDEAEFTENLGMNTDYSYHFRAKILSNQARNLANVEMPWNMDESGLYEWWGRTILPDGTVLELSKEDFVQQPIIRSGKEEQRVLKGALPGVVPGCIIDYGYDYLGLFSLKQLTIELTHDWPVREFRFRWKFPQRTTGSYYLKKPPGLDIQAVEDRKSILITGRNIPPIVEEPYMPAREDQRAYVQLGYYRKDVPDFWNDVAKSMARQIDAYAASDVTAVGRTLDGLGVPGGTDIFVRLQKAYDWMMENVRRMRIVGARIVDVDPASLGLRDVTPARTLEAKTAIDFEMTRLYIAFARHLGMQADLVLARDFRDGHYDPDLQNESQMNEPLVALRLPHDPPEKALYVDPASRLPHGLIPWWVSNTDALVATAQGARPVTLPPPDPERSLSETKGTISFVEDNAKVLVQWTREATGLRGADERGQLREANESERQQRLIDLCGGSITQQAQKASSPGYNYVGTPYRLDCQSTTDSTIDASVRTYRLPLRGVWFEETPDLTDPTRILPIRFPFPHIDHCVLVVVPPIDFHTGTDPAPISFEGKYGSYKLTVTKTPVGSYRVERTFKLAASLVPVDEYPQLRRFLAQVRRADRTRLEFRRGNPAS